jgi:hypothetical protein
MNRIAQALYNRKIKRITSDLQERNAYMRSAQHAADMDMLNAAIAGVAEAMADDSTDLDDYDRF